MAVTHLSGGKEPVATLSPYVYRGVVLSIGRQYGVIVPSECAHILGNRVGVVGDEPNTIAIDHASEPVEHGGPQGRILYGGVNLADQGNQSLLDERWHRGSPVCWIGPDFNGGAKSLTQHLRGGKLFSVKSRRLLVGQSVEVRVR